MGEFDSIADTQRGGKSLNLGEDQEVAVEITKKDNPLKELFGFGRKNRITRKEFLEARKHLESKWF